MWMDKDHGILAVTGHFIYMENQLSWVGKGLKKTTNKYQDEIFCFVDIIMEKQTLCRIDAWAVWKNRLCAE